VGIGPEPLLRPSKVEYSTLLGRKFISLLIEPPHDLAWQLIGSSKTCFRSPNYLKSAALLT
jgi:hypothetical protein